MKYVKWVLVVGYIYFIITKTILGREPMPEPILRGLFWEVQEGYLNNILMNIILFIPLGFLIGGWKGVVLGFFLSCAIEVGQYYWRLGYCELDDVMNNTIGAGIGMIIKLQIKKFHRIFKG